MFWTKARFNLKQKNKVTRKWLKYLCQPQSFRKHTTNLEPCLASNGHKMPEAASETSHLRSPKKLTEDDKILVKETWREAAKPEVQAGKKLFQK